MPMWELHDGEVEVGPHDDAHVVRMIVAGLPEATLLRAVGTEEWKSLRTHAPFALALTKRAAGYVAPQPVVPTAAPAAQAAKVKKSEFIGAGCVVQGLGFAAPVLGFFTMGPVGVVLGLVAFLALFILGSRMASFYACGACGSRLASPEATACSACRAELVTTS
jgi:hypothetical protein